MALGAEARIAPGPETRGAPRPEGRVEARRESPGRETPRAEAGGGPPEQEYKRVLSARRRLLGMLLILVISSGALVFINLAAWWVLVPPSAMLLGYMALLREAAKADAERRELARTHADGTDAPVATPATASSAAPPAPPARPVPAPDAEVIDISASLGPAGEEFYDQYADAKLRAVGDLARALTARPRAGGHERRRLHLPAFLLAGLDLQDLRAAEGDVRVEGEVLVRGQL